MPFKLLLMEVLLPGSDRIQVCGRLVTQFRKATNLLLFQARA